MRLLVPALVLLANVACGGGGKAAKKKKAPAEEPAEAVVDDEVDSEEEDEEDVDEEARKRRKRKKDPDGDEHVTLRDHDPGVEIPEVAIADLPEDAPAFVALIVLDTLRADRTALCGHDRPNTPNLQKITEQARAWSCDAYSPATWTLPAHATYFTGQPTADHGVHTLGTPLRPDADTLAEHYAAKGYQTLFVSANPVFSAPEGGFWQGFERVVAADGLGGPLRTDLGRYLKAEFERLDPERPLFLVLNIFDAHDPYPAIPKGLDWVEPQKKTSLHPYTADESNPYYRYVTDTMAAEETGPYLERIADAYDHAVSIADANLGLAVRGLAATGWLDKPYRIVITSDHGEHLGEHQLLRHGSATWQTVTRVPFLWFDTTAGAKDVTLPSPVSASITWQLLRDGTLPEPMPSVESASAHNPEDFKPSWETVAVWGDEGTKLMVFDGDLRRYDLTADPMETSPLPVPDDHPLLPLLSDRVAAHEKSLQDALDREPDAGVMDLLKSVGYVQ